MASTAQTMSELDAMRDEIGEEAYEKQKTYL
jgi:hypothetical protein